jgi:hypothetical protein
VSAALEIPATVGDLVGFRARARNQAIEAAAIALAPHDLERALKIGAQAEREGESAVRDAVLAAAARVAAAPRHVLVLLERMQRGRAVVAAEVAQRSNGSDREALLQVAAQHVDDEELRGQINVFARLAASWLPSYPDRSASAAERLREVALQEPGPDDFTWDRLRAVVEAARTVRNADASLAAWLLDRVGEQEADATTSWDLTKAARVWAEWGEIGKCRELAERVLVYERGLGWYGPASTIAELAVAVDAIDPDWARELADEALTLVENAGQTEDDPFERSRLDGTLGEVAQAFRTWDRERALRAARLMGGGSWLPGRTWDSFDGRLSALACLGLDAAHTDPELAQRLLRECVPDHEPAASLGRPIARLVRGGLFRPAEDVVSAQASSWRIANFVTYVSNAVNYWISGCEWQAFGAPADIARSVQMWPGSNGALASWAGAVAAAVEPVAAHDLEAAIDLAGWLTDPCERLIACAALVRALTGARDERAGAAMDAFGRAVMDLPRYVCEVDLQAIPQAPVLAYLNPAARARWEAALLLPPDAAPAANALAEATGSWYLAATLHAEHLWESLLAPVPPGTTCQALVEEVTQGLASVEQHPDDIQLDFIRAAAAWALAPCDPDLADSTVARIEHQGVAVLARVFAAAGAVGDPAALASACRAVFDAAPPELSALHRAAAAATAAHLISDVDASSAQELVDLGVAALQDAHALEVTTGLALLAVAADESRRTDLVRTALARANDVDNQSLRNDALADLLGPAVLTHDPSLVSAVAQRLLAADWQVLMEGLRRGMGVIVMTAGPAIVSRLDGALRSAQQVLAGEIAESVAHLDAVAAPQLREDPLTAGERAAASAPSIDLDVDALYLEADDLPGNLTLVQDSRGQGSDPGDYAFGGCDGVHAGLRVWLGEATDTVWRLVDIRFVFPDAERAAAYHAERLLANSEGNPSVDDAPVIGDECHVFGGTRSIGFADLKMTTYFYIVRVENVVVKLYVAQGVEARKPLVLEQVRRIADRIVVRVEQNGERTTMPTPNDVFSEIDERLKADPGQLTGTSAKYLFDLSGDDGGEYHIDIHDGVGDAGPGHVDNPNITITMTSGDFVDLATGKLDGARAFMSGRIEIQGDMGLAMKLQDLLS